jgi:integrase
MPPKVNLAKRIKNEDGLRFCPVVEAANGRLKSHVVFVTDREEKHIEGSYYIEWREWLRRVRLSVGNDPAEAWNARKKKEAELNAVAHGVPLADVPNGNGRRSLTVEIAAYLAEVKLTKKPATLVAYTESLRYFAESCHRSYLDDIERLDLLKFAAYLRDAKGLAPRSCWNKFSHTVTFLKTRGIRGLVRTNDWPRFTEETPEIYEQADLDALFVACDADERLWFEFFLMTGLREQEVAYCYWSDIDFKNSTVTVSAKPDRGWSPKAYKGRVVPIPARLVDALKALKARSGDRCAMIFPTRHGTPRTDFYVRLQACADRAGLDPRDFWLHKFRATFATRWLRKSDLATVQRFLGHSNLKSTMRYLRPAEAQAEKADEVFA